MAHNQDPELTKSDVGDRRTGLTGLRQVDAQGHAQRIQEIALKICLEKAGGRIEIARSELDNSDLTRNIVIRGGVSEKTAEPTIIIEFS